MSRRCIDYTIADESLTACPKGDDYVVTSRRTLQHVCTIYRDGSRWVHSSYPGKKWPSMLLALEYGSTQARSAR